MFARINRQPSEGCRHIHRERGRGRQNKCNCNVATAAAYTTSSNCVLLSLTLVVAALVDTLHSGTAIIRTSVLPQRQQQQQQQQLHVHKAALCIIIWCILHRKQRPAPVLNVQVTLRCGKGCQGVAGRRKEVDWRPETVLQAQELSLEQKLSARSWFMHVFSVKNAH